MNHKQFALIFVVWLTVTSLLFCVPARSAEVGLVQTKGAPTCEEAKQDLLAVGIRLNRLKEEFSAETDDHLRFVIKEEAKALVVLVRKIQMFRVENCRNA